MASANVICHDYHLLEYRVADFGRTIEFDLRLTSEKSSESLSFKFEKVLFYHFTHTQSAVLSNVIHVSLLELLEERWESFVAWNEQHGIEHFVPDRLEFTSILMDEGYTAWELCSALGFAGFVIAKEVSQRIRH